MAGFIDKNIFLAGRGAKTIVNEVTSTRPSSLYGFIEVAGNPADVVIVNPNGMVVNGLGFINSKHVSLDTSRQLDVVGKGLNANEVEITTIQSANFQNLHSELWGKAIQIRTEDTLNNAGKIGVADLAMQTKTLMNVGFIESAGDIAITADHLTQQQGTMKATEALRIAINDVKNTDHSLLVADKHITVQGNELENTASHIVSNGDMRLQVTGIHNQERGAIVTNKQLVIIGDTLANTQGQVLAQGGATIQLGKQFLNRHNGLISIRGDSHVTATTVLNEESLLHVGGNLEIAANTVKNWNRSGAYYGGEMNVEGNLQITAKYSFENRSSDIMAKGNIAINAPRISNHKETFETDWIVTEEDHYEKIPHLNQRNYYDADRRYHRVIHTGQITKETADARIISSESIHMEADTLSNQYSHIMAEKDLTLLAQTLVNIGYQGTVHFDDAGRDRHYWKYKKRRRWWKRSKWIHGHTDFLYENHRVFDQEPGADSERLAVLASLGTTAIQATEVTNKTIEADGSEYEMRAKAVDTAFEKVAPPGNALDNILSHAKKQYLTEDPLATFTKETSPTYIDKKQFLSSEYMLARLQADPEHVQNRLRSNYAAQESVREQLRQLTNQNKYSSIVLGKDVRMHSYLLDNTGMIQAAQGATIETSALYNHGGAIAGSTLAINADTVRNVSGHMHAKERLTIKANDLRNETKKTTSAATGYQKDFLHHTASIVSEGDSTLHISTITNVGSRVTAGKNLTITAKNLSVSSLASTYHVATTEAQIDSTNYTGSTLQGNQVEIHSDTLASQGSDIIGNTIAITANHVDLANVKNYDFMDVAVGSRGSDYFSRKLTENESSVDSQLLAQNGIRLAVANDLQVKASTIYTKTGPTDIQAGSISIMNDTEHHELLEEHHEKTHKLLSSKTTDIYNHQLVDTVVGSRISSGTVRLESDRDVRVKASDIVADTDISIAAKGRVALLSGTETAASTYIKQVKKSGIFSGGGLSVTVGKQRQKDSYDTVSTTEKGSLLGSNAGSVVITSLGETTIQASDVLAKKDITVNGSKIDVVHGYDSASNQEKHEFKKSGLTVSLSNDLLDTATGFASTMHQATTAKDERLQALLAYKAYDDASKALEKANVKTQAKSLNLHVSLGRESFSSNAIVRTNQAKNTHLLAEGDIQLTTTQDDITLQGGRVMAENIYLQTAKDIHISGSENTATVSSQSQSQSAALGVSYDLLKGSISDIRFSANGSKGSVQGTDITHDPARVQATQRVDIQSQGDVTITDGKIEGKKIVANVGGNLQIQSVQDIHTYTEGNVSAGLGTSFSGTGKFNSANGSFNKTDIDSDYQSVVHQAGMYAGTEGFDVHVGDTTTLVGAVLASETDSNRLTTKNLVTEDIANTAEYSYTSRGLSYLKDTGIRKNGERYNETGLAPNIMAGENGADSSVTYAAIANGQLEVENTSVDVRMLRRHTEQSLNTLAEIFDKQSIEERQQTAKLFSKYANEAIRRFGEIRGKDGKRKYKDGSAEKIALHAIQGAINASIVKGDVTSGAVAGGLNEAFINQITKLSKDRPDVAQIVSASLGYAVDKVAGGTGNTGASIAQAGSKWNRFGGGHENKKMVATAIGIDESGLGHTSLIIKFEDGTYEEANFGRYGKDITMITSIGPASPIGSGTYVFDNEYFLGKDGKRIYFIDVNPNDVAYIYNTLMINRGYKAITSEGKHGFSLEKIKHRRIMVYRNGSDNDYDMFAHNCTTVSIEPIILLLGNKYHTTTRLKYAISPGTAKEILEEIGIKEGFVTDVY